MTARLRMRPRYLLTRRGGVKDGNGASTTGPKGPVLLPDTHGPRPFASKSGRILGRRVRIWLPRDRDYSPRGVGQSTGGAKRFRGRPRLNVTATVRYTRIGFPLQEAGA
jgi:hypothetical protein